MCSVSSPVTDRLHLLPARADKVAAMYLPYIDNEIRCGVIALQVRVCVNMGEVFICCNMLTLHSTYEVVELRIEEKTDRNLLKKETETNG